MTSRVETALLVVFAAVAPNEAAKDFGAVSALVLVVMLHTSGWFRLVTLTGRRPGFPLYLLYSRPVRTAVAVGVPMAYQALFPAALYLVSALLLRITSGYALPLLPVAAWITAINVASLATNWSIRNVAVRLLGNLALGMAWLGLAAHRLKVGGIPGPDWAPPHQWPTLFAFPLTDYALIGAIGLASFGLAVAGVARQHHDGRPAIAWTPGTGFSDRLVSLFRLPCPISSATRAQVWFELKSSGLPLLMIGVALAIVNPLLFALSVPVESIRTFAVLCGMFSVLTVLILGSNAFGIRGWPTHRYASAFEATRAYETARLAVVKVLVRSVCMLAALIAVGVSVWASLSLIAVGKGYEPLRSWHLAFESAIGALTGYQQIALAAVASIGVVVMVASHASLAALAARYPRRLSIGIAGWVVLIHGFLLVPLV